MPGPPVLIKDLAVVVHAEVQMRAGRVSGGSADGDLLAGRYVLTYPHHHPAQVSIERHVPVSVTDDDHLSVAIVGIRRLPSGKGHHTGGRRQDRLVHDVVVVSV